MNRTLLLDRHVETPATATLGPVVTREDIRSSIGPFLTLPGYRTIYPEIVIRALGELYLEYNRAFAPLVEANREWSTDYQCCMGQDGPINFAVQIDMVGLPQGFLDAVTSMPLDDVREILRRRIFEIENSLAVYQLLERFFPKERGDSFFKERFRATLADLRQRFGRPIALLAVTDQKYAAMRESEFGKGITDDGLVSDDEVFELSGFDRFFGPNEFRRHVEKNRGGCEYLLYARTSDPVAKLKKPELEIEHPLLGDPKVRRVIKAHALTFNVDAPDWLVGDERRINDTKSYMASMGMAFQIESFTDLLSAEFAAHLTTGKTYGDFVGVNRLSRGFTAYLESQGIDPKEAESGEIHLRAKPAKGAYGCYGHVVGALTDGDFRSGLRRNMRRRGHYVVQLEMDRPTITNMVNGVAYTYIDRNFFGIVHGQPQFLGGFRSMMPLDSIEAQKGRNHGNASTVTAEIVS